MANDLINHVYVMLLLVTQSCLTLCDPTDCNPPGSPVHEILQARILEWVAIFSSKGIFPTQGSNPSLLHLLHLQAGFFTTSAIGKLGYPTAFQKSHQDITKDTFTASIT